MHENKTVHIINNNFTNLELDNYILRTHHYSDKLNLGRHHFDTCCRLSYNRLKMIFVKRGN